MPRMNHCKPSESIFGERREDSALQKRPEAECPLAHRRSASRARDPRRTRRRRCMVGHYGKSLRPNGPGRAMGRIPADCRLPATGGGRLSRLPAGLPIGKALGTTSHWPRDCRQRTDYDRLRCEPLATGRGTSCVRCRWPRPDLRLLQGTARGPCHPDPSTRMVQRLCRDRCLDRPINRMTQHSVESEIEQAQVQAGLRAN